jgi:hypothetical protein
MTDYNQIVPLLAGYDLYQNQSYITKSQIFWGFGTGWVGQASLQMENLDISLCV